MNKFFVFFYYRFSKFSFKAVIILGISSNILKGNPYNWNYQVVVVKNGEVLDFIENKDKKEKMFKSLPLQINMYNYIN